MTDGEALQPPVSLTVEQALQQAVVHHKAGQLQDAERLYRAILHAKPSHPDANHNLGVLAAQVKQPDAGLPHFKAALEANPNNGQYWLSYIDVLMQTGQSDTARQVLAQARQRGLQGEAVEALAGRLDELLPVVAAAPQPGKKIPKTKHANKSAKESGLHPKKTPDSQEINKLVALFTAGRYAEAASIAESLTLRLPLHPLGWKALGTVFQQMGRIADALALMQKALTLSPGDAEVHNNLGTILKNMGRLSEAEASYRRALQIKPDYAEAHNNLGVTLHDQARESEAEASYRRALQIKSDHAEAYYNLAISIYSLGRLDEAETSYRRVVQIKPDHAEAHNNLGITLHDMGRLDEAETSYRRVVQIKPDHYEAHNNLGITLHYIGRLDEAETSYRRALQIKPDFTEAYSNLGITLRTMGRLVEAEASCRRALQIKPDFAEAYSILGNVLGGLGRLEEAEACCRRALQIKPDFAAAHSNLGNVLKDFGRIEEAAASCRRALEFKPDNKEGFGSLLFILNYHPDKNAEEIYTAYQEYDQCFGLPYRSQWRNHSNNPERQRRLKVAYVSADFRKHAARHFLEPLLANHDKHKMEVYAYAELMREDSVTERLKGYVDRWIPTIGMGDAALAERIRADGIDILIDLMGHTANNRLGVFALKPAPVSVSWLGYGYTTGLTAVDYYLTDETSAPEGSEGLFSETPYRLATPGYAYRPAEGMGEVGALPAAGRGVVTFGTLTRAVRINHRTIRVWSEILKRVAGSRLVIDSRNFADATVQKGLAEKFAAHGIDPERLEIGHHSPPWDVLRGMDIGLDCFPHNSGTTLFETLYMGVPFVTLAGRPSVGRLGSSILEGGGHPEWIAHTEDDYIEIAVALAADLPKLATLRGGLRQEMQASALMDEAGFARKVEAAYENMFGIWSENKQ